MSGTINKEWIEECRCNESSDSTIETWFAQVFNCRKVEISEDGSVWIEDPQAGHWLEQERIDEAIAAIDSGI